MLYFFIRPFARIALKLFLREIHLSNADRIPKDKPVILAANHPTAFIEPCIMACFQEQPLFFLARGNLFGNRFFDFLLSQVHILPVYRLSDRGYNHLKKNYSTFEACYQALGQNKVLMILAEGSTVHEKRLRPLVKGTGRIAFGTLDYNQGLEDVYIIPVGVNYTRATRFRSDLYVDFAEPISTAAFLKSYHENNNKGILELTRELHRRLKEKVIHINDAGDDEGLEVLLEINRPNTIKPAFPILRTTSEQLEKEKEIVNNINAMDSVRKEKLLYKALYFKKQLSRLKIDENALKSRSKLDQYAGWFLVLSFPLFLLGVLLNFPPIAIASYIAKNKVKYIEFYTSVLLVFSLGLYLFYLPFLGYIMGGFGGYWWLAALIIAPILGTFAIYYWQIWKNYRNNKRWDARPEEERKQLSLFLTQTDHFLNDRKKLK